MPTPPPTSPFVLRFVGGSGVGKTTVLEAIVQELRAQGITVGCLKHSGHCHPLEPAGSDSARLGAAADGPSAFVTPEGVVLRAPPPPLSRLLALAFSRCEIVLVEGWRSETTPVVRMLHDSSDPDAQRECGGTVLGWLVRDGSPAPGRALPHDPARLATLILRWAQHPSVS